MTAEYHGPCVPAYSFGRVLAMGNSGQAKKKGKRIVYTGEGALHAFRERVGYTFKDMHCRTLSDMSEQEIRALEHEYGAKVVRPS